MSCITLLSDLGLSDAPVAIARGVLMQHVPGATMVDISHEVQPFNHAQAAYLLSGVYKHFPQGTIHLLVFDLFSDTAPRVILSEHQGQYFLCADNGLLPSALRALPQRSWLCLELAGEDDYVAWLHAAGRTIAMLHQHKKPAEAGLAEYTLKPGKINEARITGRIAECDVIHIDQYENVVTNMTRQRFEALRGAGRFTLQFMLVEEVREISSHYQDVREGYKLCRFNSNGYLEICVNHGNAAGLYGLQIGSRHNEIKIFFE